MIKQFLCVMNRLRHASLFDLPALIQTFSLDRSVMIASLPYQSSFDDQSFLNSYLDQPMLQSSHQFFSANQILWQMNAQLQP